MRKLGVIGIGNVGVTVALYDRFSRDRRRTCDDRYQ